MNQIIPPCDTFNELTPLTCSPQTLFYTSNGYYAGYVICKQDKGYRVILTQNELGENITVHTVIPFESQVKPIRQNKSSVSIHASPTCRDEIIAEGYIKAGDSICCRIGSGVTGRKEIGQTSGYPIYTPITFHNDHHRNTFMYASSFITQIVDEYLKSDKVVLPLLEQTCWLLNVGLIVDDFPTINTEALLEALMNFCIDYKLSYPGTYLRQPLNYVFDILGIDGCINLKDDLCISYIPNDYEGIIYRSINESTDDSSK